MTTPTHDFKPGDLIRLDREPVKGYDQIGDVFVAEPQADCAASSVCFKYAGKSSVTWRPASYFSLIARAGERVQFQPGDVVECIEASTVGHVGVVGNRYTAASASTHNGDNSTFEVAEKEPGRMSNGSTASRFRLVHRPDPVKAAEPARPAHTLTVGERIQHNGADCDYWRKADVWVITDVRNRTGSNLPYSINLRRESDGADRDNVGLFQWRVADPKPAPTYADGEPHPENPFRKGDRVRHSAPSITEGTVSKIAGLVIDVTWDNGACEGHAYYPRDLVLTAPAVGPLTSTKGLSVGDVLRVIEPAYNLADGEIVTITEISALVSIGQQGGRLEVSAGGGLWFPRRFAFVGRPDADGWISWAGGECPLPNGTRFEVKNSAGQAVKEPHTVGITSTDWGDPRYHITAFRLVKPAEAPSIAPTVEEMAAPLTIADVARDLRPIRFEDMKAGDRVRITVETTSINDHPGEPGCTYTLDAEEMASATIERLPEPLKIGDKVREIVEPGSFAALNCDCPAVEGEIVFERHGNVVVDDGDELWVFETRELERIA